MSITFIGSNRADINVQLALLKPAFNGVKNVKEEFELCCNAVKNKEAGLYHLKGDGMNVRFVGRVVDDGYQLWALVGVGYIRAVEQILKIVKKQGYRYIRCHSVRPGITRMLRRFGVSVLQQQDETIHTLYFNKEL